MLQAVLRSPEYIRVRSDYQTADLTMDAATFFNIQPGEVTQFEINEVYTQYQADWNEWPVFEGAPFRDVDGNGVYDASVDTPGVPSASQTVFIKYDDSNSSSLYGSPPIGLEVSEIYWAFSEVPSLDNVIFKMVDLIYTGVPQSPPGSYIDSMYLCQWADPDIGNYTDDLAGCDTALNLGYAYNAYPVDDIYQGIGYEPPASGYAMLQGASEFTGNPADSAIINFHWRHGYKYFRKNPMSSFIYFASDGSWGDPAFTYTGTLEFYNLMRGYLPDPPYPSSVPFPANIADYTESGCYLLAGDPVSGTGKVDGIVDNPGDRRMLLTHGPFHMDLGDTIQVVSALMTASGSDFLESITELRKIAFSADSAFQTYAEHSYFTGIDTKMPDNFSFRLFQNYPNPFNPATKIRWQSPVSSVQTLKVYDILGREVATLVNEYRTAGKYEIIFYNSQLPSGVYFYQLRATPVGGQAGDPSAGSGQVFIQTKKMILLK